MPAKAIAQIIGHANANYVLNIYAQLENMELRKAIFALETDKTKRGDNVEITLLFNKEMYQELVHKAYESGFPIDVYLHREIEMQCHSA
ncbi:hypothetical protein SDC9_212351 [bioreactor metagenome]|uniref:Uncharacterized protein n=1 Tax=bioreactor metagenome TaxID=1076179 RepID=A0A645JLN2_9ZZZZ